MQLNSAQLTAPGTGHAEVDSALAVRQAFTSFVGETFFSQMIKSMRSTTDKPAYFHGGRGEEVFQAQLDQELSQQMTAASADKFAHPMFEKQFPQLGKVLREYEQRNNQSPGLDLRA